MYLVIANPKMKISPAKLIRSGVGCQVGFTLIELLIALILSSIIFTSAYQVISNLAKYQVRASTRYLVDQDKRLLAGLVENIIEQGIDQHSLPFAVQREWLFDGRSDSLRLVSRAYSRNFDLPGHRVYRLYQRDGELHVAYRRYDENFRANRRVDLATGLRLDSIHFEYFHDGRWLSQWDDTDSLPRYIRVRIDLAAGEALDLIRGMARR